MIRWLANWWLARKIMAAQYDSLYWRRGRAEALRRADEYKAKEKAANARIVALSKQQSELDYPINWKGNTQ